MVLQVFLIVLSVALTVVHAYPNGPPVSACQHMYPVGHNTDAQTSSAIVSFMLQNTKRAEAKMYSAGETITITLKTANTSDTSVYYEGLFVQARRANCESDKQTEPVGTFTFNSSSNFLKTLDCGGNHKSAICHKDHIHQTEQTFNWTAPSPTVGHIYFQATVVRNTKTFWTGVQSSFLRDSSDTSNPHYCQVRKTNVADVKTPTVFVVVVGLMISVANVLSQS